MKAWHILIFIASFLVFGFFTRPKIEAATALRAENKHLEAQIQEINTQLQSINRLQKESIDNKTQLIKQIPLLNEQENLMKDIQTLTARNGFSFTALSFTKGLNPALGIPEIRISFATEGNKKNLIPFLRAIEDNERFLGLESLSIKTHQQGSAQTVQFSVSLYAFYQQ